MTFMANFEKQRMKMIKEPQFRWKARRCGSGSLGPVSHRFESGLAVNCEARGASIKIIDNLARDEHYGTKEKEPCKETAHPGLLSGAKNDSIEWNISR